MRNFHRRVLFAMGLIFFMSIIGHLAQGEEEGRCMIWINKESVGQQIGDLLNLPGGGTSGVLEHGPVRLTRGVLTNVERHWEQSSFYQDFGFTVKEERNVREGSELRTKYNSEKMYDFTRPEDRSTIVTLGIGKCEQGNKGQIMFATVDFELSDPNKQLWAETLLNTVGIDERRFGKQPLNFIQGSMMQRQSRTARIRIPGDSLSRYKIKCVMLKQ